MNRSRSIDDSQQPRLNESRRSDIESAAAGAVGSRLKSPPPKFFSRRIHMVVGALFFACAACHSERVEYHRRPSFYQRASTEKLPDEVVLEDGTVVKYVTVKRPPVAGYAVGESTPFELRETKPDGTVALHALLPEHVLTNALICIRDQEYQLLWDELLSQRTKQEYARAGQGIEEFTEFFRKNRHELVATLTRMVASVASHEVSFTPLGDGVTRCRLRPQIADQFRFKMVDVVAEPGEAPDPAAGQTHAGMLALPELKLLTIR